MNTEEKNVRMDAGANGNEPWMDVSAAERQKQEYLKRKQEELERKVTPAKIRNIFYLGIFLFLVCAVAATVMCFASGVTRIPRKKAKQKKLVSALNEVLPPYNNAILNTAESKESSGNIKSTLYTAKKDGKVAGYAVQISAPEGYGGKMEALISFSPEGRVYSFVITEHSETPGLGSEVTDRKDIRTFATLFAEKKKKPFPENLPPGKVLDQFRSRSVNTAPWRLRTEGGDIDGRSGATISSKAVTLLASRAAEILKEKLQKEGQKK